MDKYIHVGGGFDGLILGNGYEGGPVNPYRDLNVWQPLGWPPPSPSLGASAGPARALGIERDKENRENSNSEIVGKDTGIVSLTILWISGR